MTYDILERLNSIYIRPNVNLSEVTFTETGGPADYMAFPKTINEVSRLVNYAATSNMPVTVLGGASNVIVRDGGIRGLVIITTALNHIEIEDDKLVAEAGAQLYDVAEAAADASLSGLEFACGIPGSIGGAIYMNAGAYEGAMGMTLAGVKACDSDGRITTYSAEELDMGYRHSRFMDEPEVIVEAQFDLIPADPSVVKATMEELDAKRDASQPLELPSCGSVFKRPEGHFAGQLIADAGMQGHIVGGAQVSMKHAGFIVNKGDATASDYLKLISQIQEAVKEQFDVELELEVRVIGEEVQN